ncbi:MAG: hypothetical protein R8G66_08880 [Cytophagales bacterium]|nr:hypothetical protein [Cytophagales bacterium]
MKLDPNDIDLIEKYLDGELIQEDQQFFKRKEAASEEFRDAVSFHRQLLGHLQAQQKLALKTELRGMMNESKEPRKFNWKMLSIAASILLIGIISVLQFQGPPPSQQLFDQYFDPYPVMSIVRGSNDNSANPLRMYAEGKYEQFIDKLTKGDAVTNQQRTAQLQLALGNAYLVLAQPEQAIKTLSEIEIGDDHFLDAQWYLALANLQLQRFEAANEYLLKLTTEPSFYRSSAKKLIAAIQDTRD